MARALRTTKRSSKGEKQTSATGTFSTMFKIATEREMCWTQKRTVPYHLIDSVSKRKKPEVPEKRYTYLPACLMLPTKHEILHGCLDASALYNITREQIGVYGGMFMRRILTLLSLVLAILTFARFEIKLPVFSMPEFDSRNGIIEVFTDFSEQNLLLEVTVVFADEDHPCALLDFLYDAYRFFRYGRVEDIETFYVRYNSDGQIIVIDFPGVFSGDHSFTDTKDLHGSAVLMIQFITFLEDRPIVFVNTWNHMFGVMPSFDRATEILFLDYVLTDGKRIDAERKYSWHY